MYYKETEFAGIGVDQIQLKSIRKIATKYDFLDALKLHPPTSHLGIFFKNGGHGGGAIFGKNE